MRATTLSPLHLQAAVKAPEPASAPVIQIEHALPAAAQGAPCLQGPQSDAVLELRRAAVLAAALRGAAARGSLAQPVAASTAQAVPAATHAASQQLPPAAVPANFLPSTSSSTVEAATATADKPVLSQQQGVQPPVPSAPAEVTGNDKGTPSTAAGVEAIQVPAGQTAAASQQQVTQALVPSGKPNVSTAYFAGLASSSPGPATAVQTAAASDELLTASSTRQPAGPSHVLQPSCDHAKLLPAAAVASQQISIAPAPNASTVPESVTFAPTTDTGSVQPVPAEAALPKQQGVQAVGLPGIQPAVLSRHQPAISSAVQAAQPSGTALPQSLSQGSPARPKTASSAQQASSQAAAASKLGTAASLGTVLPSGSSEGKAAAAAHPVNPKQINPKQIKSKQKGAQTTVPSAPPSVTSLNQGSIPEVAGAEVTQSPIAETAAASKQEASAKPAVCGGALVDLPSSGTAQETAGKAAAASDQLPTASSDQQPAVASLKPPKAASEEVATAPSTAGPSASSLAHKARSRLRLVRPSVSVATQSASAASSVPSSIMHASAAASSVSSPAPCGVRATSGQPGSPDSISISNQPLPQQDPMAAASSRPTSPPATQARMFVVAAEIALRLWKPCGSRVHLSDVTRNLSCNA